MKFENDFHGYSKAEKVIVIVVLAIVVLAVISWVVEGFAATVDATNHHVCDIGMKTRSNNQEHSGAINAQSYSSNQSIP